MNENVENGSRLRFKGKFIKKATYNHRVAVQKVGKANKKKIVTDNEDDVKKRKSDTEEEPAFKSINSKSQDTSLDPDHAEDIDGISKMRDDGEQGFNEPITVGNRIMDVRFLAEALECTVCEQTLSFRNIEKETKRGLGSLLYIRCANCLLVKKVPTSKCLEEKQQNARHNFEINSQMALGCIHIGIGNQRLNKLLSYMGLPTVPYNTQKFYERKVGSVLEAVTEKKL